MHGNVRPFGLVSSVLAAVGSSGSLALLSVGLFNNWSNRRSWCFGISHMQASERQPRPGQPRQQPVIRFAIIAAQLIAFTFLVLVVELTIVWNDVIGVNSVMQTGQLIPLVIGGGVLVQVIWTCIFQRRLQPISSSSYPLSES